MTTSHGASERLSDSGRRAHKASIAQAKALAKELTHQSSALYETALQKRPGRQHPLAAAALRRFEDACRRVAGELADLAAQKPGQSKYLRPMLFGESGVGKSTLHAALLGESGAGISPDGSLNFTKEPHAVNWAGCLISDVPGFNGADTGEVDPQRLHRLTLAELKNADLVLLCFRDRNQKESEFREIAEEVISKGKPAVALLNVAASMWRRPYEQFCSTNAERRELSDDVLKQAHRIRSQLAFYGLPDVPIIAVQAQLAAFARCRPYKGQDPVSQHKIITAHGVDRVMEWSNLPVLMELLEETIGNHGVDLRLGSYRRTIAAELAGHCASLDGTAYDLADTANGVANGLNRRLAVTGTPIAVEPDFSGLKVGAAELADLTQAYQLTRLEIERLRQLGHPVPVVARGTALTFADLVIEAELAPLQRRALDNVDRFVNETMTLHRKHSEDEVRAAVFEGVDMDAATRRAYGRFLGHLEEHLDSITVRLPEFGAAGPVGLGPATGRDGRARRVLGRLVPLAGGIAAVAFWNPLGWAAALIGVGASLLGRVLIWWSQRAREESRNKLRTSLRQAVTTYFTDQRADMVRHAELTMAAALAATSEIVQAARGLREAERRTRWHVAGLQEIIDGIGTPPSGPAIIAEAARTVLQRRAGNDPEAAYQVFLGESWCTDPYGLRGHGQQFAPEKECPIAPEDLVTGPRLRWKLHELAQHPQPGSGRAWLDEATKALRHDRDARPLLRELAHLARRTDPEIMICGNYDGGKTTLIKRLLRDRGLPIPASLMSGVGPSTNRADAYEWEGYSLVDTPGFDSGVPEHTAGALAAAPTAAVVCYLFNPDLGGGTRKDLRALLTGDTARGQVAKIDRTVFVINRSDLHGVDPRSDPGEFARCCRTKEEELVKVINEIAGDHRIDERSVVSIATHARWTRGEPRAWDGMADFAAALKSARPMLAAHAADISVLHRGVLGFGQLVEKCDAEIANAEGAAARRARTVVDIERLCESALILNAAQREALSRLVHQYLEDSLAQIRDAVSDDERRARVHTLERFGQDRALLDQIDAWRLETVRRAREWCERAAQDWSGRDPGRTTPADDVLVTLRHLRGKKIFSIGDGGAVASGTLRGLAALFGEAATKIGTLARFGGRVAPGIAIGTAVLDIFLDRRDERLEQQRHHQHIADLHRAGDRYAAVVLDNDQVLPVLAEARQRLAQNIQAVQRRQQAMAGPIGELADRRAIYQRLCDTAQGTLERRHP
ncbi:GTPase [Catellatospora sp. NPDC049111]|uniref:GTPase n=1 Tax=Catellatospora sp. NPDC049111 TaxID=3155271 RepID=UPI0034000EB1